MNTEDFGSPALTISLESIGLMLAHVLAFRISTRLAHGGELSKTHLELLTAQVLGGLTVTFVAVTPVIVIGGSAGVRAAQFVLLAFVAVVGYFAARATSASRTQALFYVMIVVAVTLGVLRVKNLLHH